MDFLYILPKSVFIGFALLSGLTCFLMSQSALANVANAGFENWSRERPSGWTTIDSGIRVEQDRRITYSGRSSARITVGTRTQSATDFRQDVSVSAGETYIFSVRVRHTEGRIRARLYVDGYTQEYSQAQIRNEWQVLSYTYRASSSRDIEIGLRFYDTSFFDGSEVIYIDDFQPAADQGDGGEPPHDGGRPVLRGYYRAANGLTGYALKSALHHIINDNAIRGYGAIWSFVINYDLDRFYENDRSVLDIYSEAPRDGDPYRFRAGSDQCGNYREEGDCYNREHLFPRSWFGGDIEPMNSDIHHIFPTDGRVNAIRQSYPYGEVGRQNYVSENGSLRGRGASGLGYSGIVFEPIDEF